MLRHIVKIKGADLHPCFVCEPQGILSGGRFTSPVPGAAAVTTDHTPLLQMSTHEVTPPSTLLSAFGSNLPSCHPSSLPALTYQNAVYS